MCALHLSFATAILVDYFCQFGPSWIFGLKIEIMAWADLLGCTPEKSCIFHDIIL